MALHATIEPDDEALRVVAFRAGGHRFGIAIAIVETVIPAVEATPVPGAPRAVIGVISFHGTLVPVLDLCRRLGGRSDDPQLSDRFILIRTPARLIAVLADEVNGTRSIPAATISNLEELVPGAARLKGSAAANEGMIFIYDAESLITRSEERRLSRALRGKAQ